MCGHLASPGPVLVRTWREWRRGPQRVRESCAGPTGHGAGLDPGSPAEGGAWDGKAGFWLSYQSRRGRAPPTSLQRAQLEGRADDTEGVIRRRLEVHAEETAPLIEVYRDRGILVEVDGSGEADEVTGRIVDALDVVPQS